jgi:hypothetical protein
MRSRNAQLVQLLFFVLVAPAVFYASGCAVLYQLAYGEGPRIDANYKELENKRVAVVCMMNDSMYGGVGLTSTQIASTIEYLLRQNVPHIDVVDQDEVSDWLDMNDWDESDFLEIGRGVNADMLVAVDLDSFSLHESTTLFKGRAAVTTKVYDITRGGKEVFRTTDPEFTFPKSHPVHETATSARAFERVFIQVLSEDIAKNFYAYNLQEEFARDGAAYVH